MKYEAKRCFILYLNSKNSQNTLNICTSHRGNSIRGSVRRRVSATVIGNPAWKALYFSCSKEKIFHENRWEEKEYTFSISDLYQGYDEMSTQTNQEKISNRQHLWTFNSCLEHFWHIGWSLIHFHWSRQSSWQKQSKVLIILILQTSKRWWRWWWWYKTWSHRTRESFV